MSLTLTAKERHNIKFILFTIKQAKAARKFGFTHNESCHFLKDTLHQYWQNKILGRSSISQKKNFSRSKAAQNKLISECCAEHTVPVAVIVKHLVEMKRPSTASVFKILKKWYAVRLITKEEDARLT